LEENVKGLRIAVVDEFFEGLQGEVKSALEAVLCLYERMGATILRVQMPVLKTALPVYYILACAEASSNLGRYDGIRYGYRAACYADVDDMVVKTRTEGFGKEVKRRILLGSYVLSSGYYDAYYKKACLLRARICGEFDKLFGRCDVLVAPVAPTTAPKLGCSINPVEMYLSDVCTVPVNIAGLPAISLPCGKDSEGLPIGFQIIGGKFAEQTIFNAAYAYENAAGIC
jgi:aspartyl-tRNA(Asn)/glutamyl-tRNA(Gln) amidotransferase subunit A